MNYSSTELAFAHSLKGIARNNELKSRILESSDISPLLSSAAKRFMAGIDQKPALTIAEALNQRGYSTNIEYIGENTTSTTECERVVHEFERLIHTSAQQQLQTYISLDLSHIGLSINTQLALKHLKILAKQAHNHGMKIFVGMEEMAKTDAVLEVFHKAAAEFPNLVITLQAQLMRSTADLQALHSIDCSLRIVKGAFQEAANVALPRSKKLNSHYLNLIQIAQEQGKSVSIATHDQVLIQDVTRLGYLHHPQAELELLFGVRPEAGLQARQTDIPVRIYLPYGEEWYLYLCHRIAEHPPNIYTAFIDVIEGQPSPIEGY
ncbi:proline dehydrogenase [Paenibacillus shirakamiensis]|uniref:proline dehydrogenase n=1 Tax=Paenibacillus shirakamiensis TaxID=1265935 RepID=A0ABS4JET5_9BACL|nr:proline dehydrogenase family protein [Paenibacillus shirakamiensis]MBP2000224.1 proline dehydrogenase [Paenibacillus shirakamiensis]